MNLPANPNMMLETFPNLRQTTCPYCGVGCGIDASIAYNMNDEGKLKSEVTKVVGSPEHPANHGRLCVKGSKLVETNGLEGRLLQPEVYGKPVHWDTATATVAQKFKEIIAEHGPDSVAFYVSGQLLTEDYYVANKLMKGYIGSGNIDTNSRLCMSSAVAGYKRAFGADSVPTCYNDIEQTQLLVLVGSNAAWTHPVLFQRMTRAKQLNPSLKVVVIDPRKTATTEIADLHLALKPGSDVAIFNGLLRHLAVNDELNNRFISEHTNGFDDTISEAKNWCVERVAEYCDVPQSDLKQFFKWFAESPSSLSFYSMGVNQSSSGVDKSNAIINCHLATGKIGKPGSGPFSITGQPNAMGGREVGGLANMLAAHMDIENPVHNDLVKRFWNAPNLTQSLGLKAIDLFDAAATGQIKAIWIMATNPVASMPNREQVERALTQCEFVVVSDCVSKNDTLQFADVKLPATGWSEKNGTVTNSERRISRQRGLQIPADQARHDWQIICDVAKAMGYSGFDYGHPCEIFNEHIALSGFENSGARDFDISGLGELTRAQYDNFQPIQWPITHAKKQGTCRLFTDSQFYTEDAKARFIKVIPQRPKQQTNGSFPFALNTGRIRDQWHTMTRTSKSSLLTQHMDKPYLSISPGDAKRLDVKEGDLIEVTSAVTKKPLVLESKIDESVRNFECFAPMHWNEQFGSSSNVAWLLDSVADPISGQPELKHAAVNLKVASFQHHISLASNQSIRPSTLHDKCDYWVKATQKTSTYYQVALDAAPDSWETFFQDLFGTQYHVMRLSTPEKESFLFVSNQQIVGLAFVTKLPHQISPLWLDSVCGSSLQVDANLFSLLSGSEEKNFDLGKQVCSCFDVREKTIKEAIAQGADSVSKLGEQLRCGTNCGSCKPELSEMLSQEGSKSGSVVSEVF